MSVQNNCNSIEKLSIVCHNRYFNINVKLHDGTDLKHRFLARDNRVEMYENGVKVQQVNNPRHNVATAVALFFSELFSRRNLKIDRLEIVTSRLTTTAGNMEHALDRHWMFMFKRIQRAMRLLPAPVSVRRFYVNGHPLLKGIEVDAFWNALAPKQLEVFAHKGKPSAFYRGNLNVLTRTDQWKEAQHVFTEVFEGIAIDDVCNLKNVTVRMQDFSQYDFLRFIGKSLASDIFSTGHIKVTPIADDWKSALKKRIVREMERNSDARMEETDCYYYRMQNGRGSIVVKCIEQPDHLSIVLVKQ